MNRLAWALLLVAASGCRCGRSLEHPPRTLTASPGALEFADVPLGQQLHLALTLSAGATPVTVQLRADPGAFTFEPGSFELQPGASQRVDVVFAPASLGPAAETLTALGADQPLTIGLNGAGVPACPPAAACHQVIFVPATHACVDSALADHTACDGACISGGECRAGTCVGTSSLACDDGDPCTDDACSTEDGGCRHFEHVCPVTSACRTAVCFRDTGCTEQPVPDGTSCGPADCLEANVCLANACVTLPTPAGSADCEYTSLAASAESQTCATTVSGKLRCWGEWRAPHTVAGSSGAARVAASSKIGSPVLFGEGVCTVDSSGFEVRCYGMAGPDGGLGSPVRELDPPCAVLEDDRYVCWSDDGGVTTLATGVRSGTTVNGAGGFATGTWIGCLLGVDGGFDCTAHRYTGQVASGGAPFTSAPDRFLVPAVADAVCGQWPDAIRCRLGEVFELGDGGIELYWEDLTELDAGFLTGGGGFLGPGLLARGNQVFREDQTLLFSVANPVVQLTSTEYFGTPCLLNDQQKVWCWGDDRYGGLGLLTGNPHGLQRLPLDADQLLAAEEATLIEWDGGLWQVGGPGPLAPDSTFVQSQTNFLGPMTVASSLSYFHLQGLGGIDANGHAWWLGDASSQWQDYAHRIDLGPATAVQDWFGPMGHDLGVLRPSGRVELIDGGQVAPDVAALVRGAVLQTDGGVMSEVPFGYLQYELTAVPLPEAARLLSGNPYYSLDWCALLSGDRVFCWEVDAGNQVTAPAQVSGVASGVRQLVGGAHRGCALVGSNLAQCWGDDPRGDGVASPGVAVPIVFDEPIASLSISSDFACAQAFSGHVFCWGHNTWGQLGFAPTQANVPVKMVH